MVIFLTEQLLELEILASTILSFNFSIPIIGIQTAFEATTGIASLVIAAITVVIYRRQNKIVERQTEATTEARKASIQTLDMTFGDPNNSVIVEMSNSGGGSAESLTGIVEYITPEGLDCDIRSPSRPARRRSSSSEKTDSKPWLASEGNTVAAGESQVPVEISCGAKLPTESDEYQGFPLVVRHICNEWKKEQLTNLERHLSNERLRELGDQWDEQSLVVVADDLEKTNRLTISTEKLYEISQSVLATDEDEFNESCMVSREIQLRVSIQFDDTYLRTVGGDETNTVPVLDATFYASEDLTLKDIFEGELLTERVNRDPEGVALQF